MNSQSCGLAFWLSQTLHHGSASIKRGFMCIAHALSWVQALFASCHACAPVQACQPEPHFTSGHWEHASDAPFP
jgi:hypothetical protein